ncbi:MAG: F0F1 ATP synthase subunit delta [Bacteroidota bacterium]|nr:F0F1 ATP synthase subunit delta [Bacteroidota bacterium]
MNTGLIPVRYATALLDFANLSNQQDRVYTETKAVVGNYFQFSELKTVLDNPVLAKTEKRKVIILAAGGNVSKPFEKFVDLLMENNRESHLLSIALKYIDLFRKQKNIHYGKLTTASTINATIERRLMDMVENTTGGTIEMEKIIDPEIIGGFMFEVDFVRWDASISGQLRRIKKDYIEKNNKIV